MKQSKVNQINVWCLIAFFALADFSVKSPTMPRKSSSNGNASNVRENLKPGEILTDLTGRKWMIGKPIGVGGFGDIYSATDVINQEVKDDSPYVAKIECHSSGPLFVEINCYLRVGKLELSELQ